MGLDSRDYMRDVPIYRWLTGRKTAPAARGGGGGRQPPTNWADPPPEPSSWGSMRSARGRRQTRPWAWFLLGAIACLAVVGYVADNFAADAPPAAVDVRLGPDDPLPPGTTAVVDGIPAIGRPLRIPIGGRETVSPGTSITLEGKTPTRRGGVVVVRMRREGGAWRTLRRTLAAPNGSYRVSYRIWNPGRTQVRIVFPGGSFAYKSYRVT
jgi:hypothetical protein